MMASALDDALSVNRISFQRFFFKLFLLLHITILIGCDSGEKLDPVAHRFRARFEFLAIESRLGLEKDGLLSTDLKFCRRMEHACERESMSVSEPTTTLFRALSGYYSNGSAAIANVVRSEKDFELHGGLDLIVLADNASLVVLTQHLKRIEDLQVCLEALARFESEASQEFVDTLELAGIDDELSQACGTVFESMTRNSQRDRRRTADRKYITAGWSLLDLLIQRWGYWHLTERDTMHFDSQADGEKWNEIMLTMQEIQSVL